jgi:hypothetical protein
MVPNSRSSSTNKIFILYFRLAKILVIFTTNPALRSRFYSFFTQSLTEFHIAESAV